MSCGCGIGKTKKFFYPTVCGCATIVQDCYTPASTCAPNWKNQVVSVIKVCQEWIVPECGASVIVTLPDVTFITVGFYLWNPAYGYFKITAFDTLTKNVTLLNDCSSHFQEGGGTVPSCTNFLLQGLPPLLSQEIAICTPITETLLIVNGTASYNIEVGTSDFYQIGSTLQIDARTDVFTVTAIPDGTHLTGTLSPTPGADATIAAGTSICTLSALSNPGWYVDGTGHLVQNPTLGSDIVFGNTNGIIRQDTTDGADNKALQIFGGGGSGYTRGGSIYLWGNEVVSSGGAINLDAGAGVLGNISFSTNALFRWEITAAGHLLQDSPDGGDLVFSLLNGVIRQNTADGADSKMITISGGGGSGPNTTRGGYIQVYGNEVASVGGSINLSAGAGILGNIVFSTNTLFRWEITPTGELLQETPNGGDLVFSKANGIIRQNTANGADNQLVTIAGGGADNFGRGGFIKIHGNESPGDGGNIYITSGTPDNTVIVLSAIGVASSILFFTESSFQWSIEPDGTLKSQNSANELTGAGAALLGANCPAVTVAAPYKWIRFHLSDGSAVYVPGWK